MIRSSLLASVALVVSGCLPLADLRPWSIDAHVEQRDLEQRGRALMEAAAEAHGGLARWQEKQTTELLFRDQWRGMLRLFNPWPSAEIRARIVERPRTFDSVVTFLDPPSAGLVWGIEDWKPWRAEPGEERRETGDKDIRFMLPTAQYFVEMPFRLLEAEIFRYAGAQTHDGVVYEVVYITWGSVEANREFDQYLVYLDRETGRLAKVIYTVREMMSAVQAVCYFDDLREVDGIWVPHRMRVSQAGDGPEDWFHEMSIEQMRFDSFDRDTLQVREGITPLE